MEVIKKIVCIKLLETSIIRLYYMFTLGYKHFYNYLMQAPRDPLKIKFVDDSVSIHFDLHRYRTFTQHI